METICLNTMYYRIYGVNLLDEVRHSGCVVPMSDGDRTGLKSFTAFVSTVRITNETTDEPRSLSARGFT